MLDIAPTVCAILNLRFAPETTGAAIPEIVQDLPACRRVALLAPDALGLFAWERWQDEMPFLRSLHEQRSVILRSVMPSITPVNFATMVTGTDVSVHKVRSKTDTFACETLFDIVRSAGGKSAGIGLEGYSGSELLGRHADFWGKAKGGSDVAVAVKIVEIVKGDLPRFLIAQFGRVDDTFHCYGPSSPLVVPMLREADVLFRGLVADLKRLAYGVIILSDHGQHDVPDPQEGEDRGAHGTDVPEDRLVPCTWI